MTSIQMTTKSGA